MKSHITLAFLIFFIVSCGGNPHIHSSRGGLERSNPPLVSNQEEDRGCRAMRSLMDYKFFFSSHGNGAAGSYPSEFETFMKCKSTVIETFNSFEPGFTYLLSNRNNHDHSYELTHLAEKNYPHEKILYIEDIFSSGSLPLEIEKTIQMETLQGKDQGVDSNDAAADAKDALLWSYSAPVVSWGVHVINLKSTSDRPAKLRLFDCDRSLIKEVNVIYPKNETGIDEKHFLGFAGGMGEVCHVSLSASDISSAIAVDEHVYGR